MIRANLETVSEAMERAAKRSGRQIKDIALVAVTKKVPQERILEAVACGMSSFAESYVQEAAVKVPPLKALTKAVWHMIGHLQTNKAAKAVELFDVIQSVDSLKLLGVIDRKAGELGKVQTCFIEIKVSEEVSKSGLPESELHKFCEAAARLKNVKLGGIMTMAPYFDSPEAARPYFRKAKNIFDRLGLEHLSMGMSGDFEVAIEEGTTMVRIGSAIFGERK